MENEDPVVRLDRAVKQRETLLSQKSRLLGKLEAVRSEMDSIRQECVSLGITPERLPAEIDRVKQLLSSEIVSFEESLKKASSEINKILGVQ